MHESSRREYLTATEIGHELIWLISFLHAAHISIFVWAFVDSVS